MRSEPNFDHIARPYRWLEYLTLGRALERCRNRYLPRLLDRRQALILGDGDGRFTSNLLDINQKIRVVAVDTSAVMLELLRRRSAPAIQNDPARLRAVQQNALDYLPDSSPDLIVTHFFLDCLDQPDLNLLVSNLSRHVSTGALWLISDFQIPTGNMRIPARLYVRTLYLAFRLLTGLRVTHLPDHAKPLAGAGFIRTARQTSLFGILATEIWTYQSESPQSSFESAPFV
jgi:ubiquinone/menaquinone biosynthesis C-methylase UbiE